MDLPYSWDIPASIRARLGQKSAGKQRAMVAEGHLLLVLHKTPKPGTRHRDGIGFWRDTKGNWECSQGGIGVQTLTRHLQAYETAEKKLIDAYENAQAAKDYFLLLETMTPLHFATKNLHNTLQVARDAIPDDPDLIDLRDWAYEIERSLDLLYLNTKNAIDFTMAQKAEEQAELTDRLNTLAAIFFPLTAISCVFGMNLQNGFENVPPIMFGVVIGAGIFLGLIVKKWVLTGQFSSSTVKAVLQDIQNWFPPNA